MVNQFTTKEPKMCNKEKTVSTISHVGKTVHDKEWKEMTKMSSKWLKYLNVIPKTVRWEHRCKRLGIGLDADFLNLTSKAKAQWEK